MPLINCTPHEIVLVGEDGQEVRLPPSGFVVRASEERERIGTLLLDGVSVPVYRVSFGEPSGIPEEAEAIVVSAVAAQAIRRHRPDLVDRVYVTADPVRDESGRIIGARGLARID